MNGIHKENDSELNNAFSFTSSHEFVESEANNECRCHVNVMQKYVKPHDAGTFWRQNG